MRNTIPFAILVTSCHRDRPKQQAVRDTWGKDSDLPLKFFVGQPWLLDRAADEQYCAVEDGYQHVPHKTWRQALYVLGNEIERAFICDVDTYVDIPALYANMPTVEDYVGSRCDEGHASGGNGYWVSSRSCALIAEEDPPTGYADMWVHSVLSKNGIHLIADPRYGDGAITKHLSVNGHYDVARMYEEHAKRVK